MKRFIAVILAALMLCSSAAAFAQEPAVSVPAESNSTESAASQEPQTDSASVPSAAPESASAPAPDSTPASSESVSSDSASSETASSDPASSETTSAASEPAVQSSEAEVNFDANDQQVQFVTRLYNTLLHRAPDAVGLASWCEKINDASGNTAASIIDFFVNSPEYIGSNRTDDEYIADLYQCIFGRAPDAGGFDWHKNNLNKGMSRRYVLSKFVQSAEFTAMCNAYGVRPEKRGSIATTENRDARYETTAFVQRLYSLVMGRTADADGLNYWTGQLNARTMPVSAVVRNFFFLPEFKNKNYDDDTYVKILYRTLLDREPDAGGFNFWKQRCTNEQMGTEYVMVQMFYSAEFKNVVDTAGLLRGEMSASEFRSRNYELTQFVRRLYQICTPNQQVDVAGLNNWCAQMYSGQMTGKDVAAVFFFNLGTYNINNFDTQTVMKHLATALFNREMTYGEINTYFTPVNTDRKRGFDAIADSDACQKDYFAKVGIPTGGKSFSSFNLKAKIDGSVKEMEAVELLSGIVNAEVGTWAAYPEVLKAQAVAAHSLIRYNMERNQVAEVNYKATTDSRIRSAVSEVLRQVVTYNGKAARTVYFSYSPNNKTTSAKDAWNTNDFPYLQSVESKYDYLAKNSGAATASKTITEAQLKAIVNRMYNSDNQFTPVFTDANNPQNWIKVQNRDASGNATTLYLSLKWKNGNTYPTKATPQTKYFMDSVKALYGNNFFPSETIKDITYDAAAKVWTFSFPGSASAGSYVGMSQWGAYEYHVYEKQTYAQLLSRYYPTAKLETNYAK